MLKAAWGEANAKNTKVVCYHSVFSRTACNDKKLKEVKK